MSVMEPRVYQWMYGILSADNTVKSTFSTRIYRKSAPQTTDYPPMLILQYMGGAEQTVTNGVNILASMVFMVKGTAKTGQYASLRDGMARVNELLHRKSGDVPGARIVWCQKVAEIPLEPVVYSGETYEQIAINYRVLVHELPIPTP